MLAERAAVRRAEAVDPGGERAHPGRAAVLRVLLPPAPRLGPPAQRAVPPVQEQVPQRVPGTVLAAASHSFENGSSIARSRTARCAVPSSNAAQLNHNHYSVPSAPPAHDIRARSAKCPVQLRFIQYRKSSI
ncbi:jg22360 [Pararge aegeria aegeria]|uniref:Jg22360 protein n=1 Tax=Pararge aegeria aegeria TaxID=348720 RepID=A0A8S4QLR6_9NEOP|nr:jg22360 [Pararge aegeria aegeria]